MTQERDRSCPVRPQCKGWSSFPISRFCFAYRDFQLPLCWWAGPELVLETQAPDTSQVWPSLVPEDPGSGHGLY